MGKIQSLALVLLLSSFVSAQELPEAPHENMVLASAKNAPEPLPAVMGFVSTPTAPEAPHKYWDTPNKILLISHFALEAADFGITHRNISNGGRELSWMAKPLVERGTAGQITYFAGRSAAVMGMSYIFHKTGHHRLERAFIALANADSAYGVTYSLAHR